MKNIEKCSIDGITRPLLSVVGEGPSRNTVFLRFTYGQTSLPKSTHGEKTKKSG